jgi:uncharacterized iron-regulated protein
MNLKKILFTLISIMLLVGLLTACSTVGSQEAHNMLSVEQGDKDTPTTSDRPPGPITQMEVIDMNHLTTLDNISVLLLEKRVIYVGETHDNYAHHLYQLEVIKRLHHAHPDIAIGMEMFQKPFQQTLDAYIAGKIDEQELLRKSEWFERWGYDYRLYQPILDYARTNSIPLVALNVSTELKQRVSDVGFEGLSPLERTQFPTEIDRSDLAYIERLREVFHQHPGSEKRNFDRFVDVQLIWDETMAETAVLYLQTYPGRKLVVLAGTGHLAYGSGIPQRVERRLVEKGVIIIPGTDIKIEPAIADFVLFPRAQVLPKTGLIGILMDPADNGVLVAGLFPEGAGSHAGIAKGDIIIELNGKPVTSTTDIRIELMGSPPGTPVQLKVVRKGMLWGEKRLDFTFDLGE